MANQRGSRRNPPDSSTAPGPDVHLGRARLLVHEEAIACLVAADAAAKTASAPLLEQVRVILREATARIEVAASASDSGAVVVKLSPKRRGEYFPRDGAATEPGARDIAEAEVYWEEAAARQPGFREEALAQIGPLLTPREVGERLGVSRATVANWRAKGKLLGVRFDDHEYRFPSWQLVASPAEGESGVLRHLAEVVNALGDAHPWDKARFFLTRQPALAGRTPLEALRSGSPDAFTSVIQAARQRGELGA